MATASGRRAVGFRSVKVVADRDRIKGDGNADAGGSSPGAIIPYGSANRMLTLSQLCDWFNITERHARRLVERRAIPYRKVGQLLRFPEAEVERWSRPATSEPEDHSTTPNPSARRSRTLPISLIE